MGQKRSALAFMARPAHYTISDHLIMRLRHRVMRAHTNESRHRDRINHRMCVDELCQLASQPMGRRTDPTSWLVQVSHWPTVNAWIKSTLCLRWWNFECTMVQWSVEGIAYLWSLYWLLTAHFNFSKWSTKKHHTSTQYFSPILLLERWSKHQKNSTYVNHGASSK